MSELFKNKYFTFNKSLFSLQGLLPKAVLLILGFVFFRHYSDFSFLPYDDNYNVYQNTHLLEKDFLYFWTNTHVNLYIPVTYSIWTLTYVLAGMDPAWFHILNVVFHLANSLLILSFLSKLNFSRTAALIGAALFLLHPIQVESVAWVTGLKDTMSFFFALLSLYLWCFNKKLRFISILLFLAALFSKPSAVTIPIALASASFLKLEGLKFVDRIKVLFKNEKLLILSFISILPVIYISKLSQKAEVALTEPISLFERIIVVLDTLGFYVLKILIPVHLFSNYGRTPAGIIASADYFLNVGVAVLFIISFIFFIKKIIQNTSHKFSLILLSAFGFLLYLPISGIVSFGYQSHSTTADRYMYPVLFTFSGLIAFAYDRIKITKYKVPADILIPVFLSLLGFAGYLQSLNWASVKSFYEFRYEGNPDDYAANHNLGLKYQLDGDIEKSNLFFSHAMKIDPKKTPPLAGLVTNYYNQSQFSKMFEFGKIHFQTEKIRELQISDESMKVIYQAFALALLRSNRPKEALPFLCLSDRLVARPNADFENLLESTKKSLKQNEQFCPKTLTELDREIFSL